MKRNLILLFAGLFAVIFSLNTYCQESPHEVINFECSFCHSQHSWKDVQFDHDQTNFPLEGRHLIVKCIDCHRLENFSIAESNCSSCHIDVHQAKLGFDCQRCHTSNSWSELNIRAIHSNTSFPLTGAHLNVDCKACHIGEVENEFSFLDTECYNCHQSEFKNNPNPIHTALGVGIDCQQCHTTSAWQPAGFKDHDRFFPIFAGSHAGEWNSCTDCHITPGNFQVFSCLTCHEHNQQDMDHEHREVSGYVYLSSACYSCHPDGRGDD